MSNNSIFYKVIKLERIDTEYEEGEILEFEDECKNDKGEQYNTLWFYGKNDGLYRWQVEEVKQFKVNQEVTFMVAIEAMEDGWIVQDKDGYSYKVTDNDFYAFSKYYKDWVEKEVSYKDIKQTYKIIGRWA